MHFMILCGEGHVQSSVGDGHPIGSGYGLHWDQGGPNCFSHALANAGTAWPVGFAWKFRGIRRPFYT